MPNSVSYSDRMNLFNELRDQLYPTPKPRDISVDEEISELVPEAPAETAGIASVKKDIPNLTAVELGDMGGGIMQAIPTPRDIEMREYESVSSVEESDLPDVASAPSVFESTREIEVNDPVSFAEISSPAVIPEYEPQSIDQRRDKFKLIKDVSFDKVYTDERDRNNPYFWKIIGDHAGSGATGVTGFDAGQWSEGRVRGVFSEDGLSEADEVIIEKLGPILGVQRGVGPKSKRNLQHAIEQSGELTRDEWDSLDRQVMESNWNKFTSEVVSLSDLADWEDSVPGITGLLFGQYHRGSFGPGKRNEKTGKLIGSPKTLRLLNEGDFAGAAREWDNNQEIFQKGTKFLNPTTHRDIKGVIKRHFETGNALRALAGMEPLDMGNYPVADIGMRGGGPVRDVYHRRLI